MGPLPVLGEADDRMEAPARTGGVGCCEKVRPLAPAGGWGRLGEGRNGEA